MASPFVIVICIAVLASTISLVASETASVNCTYTDNGVTKTKKCPHACCGPIGNQWCCKPDKHSSDAVNKSTAPDVHEDVLVQGIKELLLTEPQKEVDIVLYQSADYNYIDINGCSTTTVSRKVTRTVTVPAGGYRNVYFPIEPTRVGLVKVNIGVETDLAIDIISNEILVEAEGIPKQYTLSVLVNPNERDPKTVTVKFPNGTVPGSQRVRLTVTGDIMATTINGLEELVKLPLGCGEQNMLSLAASIYMLKYLETISRIDDDFKEKAQSIMRNAYIRQLRYRHDDGSFSAFGESDESGSLWITAYVMKTFVQAKPYIFIYDGYIEDMIQWIFKQQKSDGYFVEPGKDGMHRTSLALTAYTAIALREAKKREEFADKIDSAKLDSAKGYLENQTNSISDDYEIAIVSYALQLIGSDQPSAPWDKLDQRSQTKDRFKRWQKEPVPSSSNLDPWEKQTQAIDIEIAAYAALTLIVRGAVSTIIPIVTWLINQRNAYGGFISTQDTVIALQALSESIPQLYFTEDDFVSFSFGTGYLEEITVNGSLNLETRQLPVNVGELTIRATGSSSGLVQVDAFYNIMEENQNDPEEVFYQTAEVRKETKTGYELRVCTSNLESGNSSMAILAVAPPSGITANVSTVVSTQEPKRVEQGSRRLVHFYFDEILTSKTCVAIIMNRTSLVAGAKPARIHVYDYYEPSKQATTFYHPDVNSGSVCEECGANCDFCA